MLSRDIPVHPLHSTLLSLLAIPPFNGVKALSKQVLNVLYQQVVNTSPPSVFRSKLLSNMSIGFLGAGKMAQAMARGLLASGTFTREKMIASAADEMTSIEMRSLGVYVTEHNREAVEQRDIVVLAVKPHVVPMVLNEVAPIITPENLIVSIAAGVTLDSMERCLPGKSRVVRVMPNIPTLVRQGASAFALGRHVTDRDCDTVKKLMSAVGYVEQVEEKDVAAVTGLSGSGPAYCFMAIEALADGGVKAGLPRKVAINLAAHTLLGSARLVLETGKHPGELKDAVFSPEGSTAYAVHSLEKAGLRATLMDAVEAALMRSQELGRLTKKIDIQDSLEW